MSTIAIVGAGSGLGLSLARVFGHKGFDVALISRRQARLDDLAARLAEEGITAAGFAADVLDPAGVANAFERVKAHFGEVEVLEYSPVPRCPAPGAEPAGAPGITMDILRPQIDLCLGGAIAVVRQVLPGMIERGSGTLIFTTGMSSLHPVPGMASVGIAAAGLRNWVHGLHAGLTGTGVHAAHIAIGASAPADAETAPIAALYWDVYTNRDQVELLLA